LSPKPFYNRHNEVPLLHSGQAAVEAADYNEVQTALKQFGNQIRFRLPKLKHLDLILQKNAWIVVDRALSDFPLLAWTGFQTAGRYSLQEPVKCEVKVFHFAANTVLKSTLEAMELVLGERLAKMISVDKADVIPIK